MTIEPRRVELPDGRIVVVRAGTRDDVDGLAELYANLSVEDTYLRFFSAHRPGPELFEHMVSLPDRGGALLVVEANGEANDDAVDDATRGAGRRGPIVGDAWYSMLPNGDGELAITVAQEWRGWLGGYLLDVLLEVAAANGVPNLEAEIMLRNGPMMGLARRRGCIRMADDGAAVRVALASRGGVPSWPPASRHPRLLVEGRRNWHAHDAATRRGLSVLVCPGPGSEPENCPALSGGTCPLAEQADAIVVAFAASNPEARELVRSHRDRHPELPVLGEARSAEAVGEGIAVVDPADDEDDVIELILQALRTTDDSALRHQPGRRSDGSAT